MSNVTQFPRFPIHSVPDAPIQSVPVTRRSLPDPKPVPQAKLTADEMGDRAQHLANVRLEIDLAIRKLKVLTEMYGETPWAVRLIENHLTDLKAFAEKQP